MWFTKFIEHNISPIKCVGNYANPDILFCSCFNNKNVINLKGNLFTDNAKNIVNSYYEDLINNIKKLLTG